MNLSAKADRKPEPIYGGDAEIAFLNDEDAVSVISTRREVVAVPAREAWPGYQRFGAYVTKVNRAFRRVQYLAFYSDGQIQSSVPKILSHHPEVKLKSGIYEGALGEVVQRVLDDEEWPWKPYTATVFLLSGPDDPETIKLGLPIVNNLPSAFARGQRYITLGSLCKAKRTSDLV